MFGVRKGDGIMSHVQLPQWLQELAEGQAKAEDWPNKIYPGVAFGAREVVAALNDSDDAQVCLLQVLIDEVESRRTIVADLQAIVDKLPKTHDRVPVVIHVDKVWFLLDGEPSCQVVPPDCVTLGGTVAECYSSAEALRAAIDKAEGKGEEAGS